MKKKILAALAVVLVLCLAGCAASLERKLVGKWENELFQVEFMADGTCVIRNAFGTSLRGTWKATGSKTATLLMDDDELKATATLDGNVLTLDDGDETILFSKAKD